MIAAVFLGALPRLVKQRGDEYRMCVGVCKTVKLAGAMQSIFAPARSFPSVRVRGKVTVSQNGRFSTKKSGQFRGLTKDALVALPTSTE